MFQYLKSQWKDYVWKVQLRSLSQSIIGADLERFLSLVQTLGEDPRFSSVKIDFLGLVIEEGRELAFAEPFLAKDLNQKTSSGRFLVHLATENGREEHLKLLLTEGADPNVADENGVTALHISYSYDQMGHISDLLIQMGANPMMRDKLGKRYLM
ncbi:ankyrin repeat protein [Leptospira ryugenii]|uniref:Ankyrin repeat protein n=1 Tax=Leptospira ryugenii TaxID=1917863 RepID=A0A2P2E3F3_9LEPT|nr:ankyrin repeat domain-containing protein [Leptospira ryugenii]GBF51435.1 ankyrin repeat protein [Leptospira ryugenii]